MIFWKLPLVVCKTILSSIKVLLTNVGNILSVLTIYLKMSLPWLRATLSYFWKRTVIIRGEKRGLILFECWTNTRKMYKLFFDTHPDVKCSEHTDRDIFKSDYKLRFGLPRSDTWSYCHRLFLKICRAESDDQIKNHNISDRNWNQNSHARGDAAYM